MNFKYKPVSELHSNVKLDFKILFEFCKLRIVVQLYKKCATGCSSTTSTRLLVLIKVVWCCVMCGGCMGIFKMIMCQ